MKRKIQVNSVSGIISRDEKETILSVFPKLKDKFHQSSRVKNFEEYHFDDSDYSELCEISIEQIQKITEEMEIKINDDTIEIIADFF